MSATLAEPGLMATAFARLEAEGRLLNPVLKGPTKKAGRFGFRGELALRFATRMADEARPPELTCDQVIATPLAGSQTVKAGAAGVLVFHAAVGDTMEAGQLVAEIIDPVAGTSTPVRAEVAGVLYARTYDRYVLPHDDLANIAGAVAYRTGNLLGA